MFNVAVCTPSTGTCKMLYAQSLAQMIMYFAQCRIYPEVAEQKIQTFSIEGSGISSNREDLVKQVIADPLGYTHILFIDEDMGFQPETLHILARKRQAVVGCNYPIRYPRMGFTALRIDTKGRIYTGKTSCGLEEAYYIGFGFALIERQVFEKTKFPRFLIGADLASEKYTTEDHPFCKQARDAGFTVYVDHDASRNVIHCGSYVYRWQEIAEGEENGNVGRKSQDSGGC